jgi:hypothetical protein
MVLFCDTVRAMDRRARLLGLPLFGLLLGAAWAGQGCGTTTTRDGFFEDAGGGPGLGSPTGDGGSGGGLAPGDASTTTTGSSGCSDAAKLVYVLSSESDLYSFAPNTLTFKKIGPLDCAAANKATPNSMAVDRAGTAWVNYSDGTLFKVSTADATCTSTTFEPFQSFYTTFGMAFSSDSAGSTSETLYVHDAVTESGLAKIDLTSLKLTVIGNAATGDLNKASAELTGTGDGRLFGFFTTTPNAKLAQLDVTSGGTSNAQTLDGVSTGTAWAFSFWGGDFWFYTSTGSGSAVTQLKASSDSSLAVVIPNTSFDIVGAGVSTCAPTSPVR